MLKGLELQVFLAVCKAVRSEQERRIRVNKEYLEASGEEFYKSTSMYIWVEAVYIDWRAIGIPSKQVFAIIYKLQELGYVKYREGHGRKRSHVQLERKGIELVKELKKNLK